MPYRIFWRHLQGVGKHGRHERGILDSPQLEVANPEFLPDLFPLPKPPPVRTPEQLSKKERDDKVARLKRAGARLWRRQA
jgi:hypothetical protein